MLSVASKTCPLVPQGLPTASHLRWRWTGAPIAPSSRRLRPPERSRSGRNCRMPSQAGEMRPPGRGRVRGGMLSRDARLGRSSARGSGALDACCGRLSGGTGGLRGGLRRLPGCGRLGGGCSGGEDHRLVPRVGVRRVGRLPGLDQAGGCVAGTGWGRARRGLGPLRGGPAVERPRRAAQVVPRNDRPCAARPATPTWSAMPRRRWG